MYVVAFVVSLILLLAVLDATNERIGQLVVVKLGLDVCLDRGQVVFDCLIVWVSAEVETAVPLAVHRTEGYEVTLRVGVVLVAGRGVHCCCCRQIAE